MTPERNRLWAEIDRELKILEANHEDLPPGAYHPRRDALLAEQDAIEYGQIRVNRVNRDG